MERYYIYCLYFQAIDEKENFDLYFDKLKTIGKVKPVADFKSEFFNINDQVMKFSNKILDGGDTFLELEKFKTIIEHRKFMDFNNNVISSFTSLLSDFNKFSDKAIKGLVLKENEIPFQSDKIIELITKSKEFLIIGKKTLSSDPMLVLLEDSAISVPCINNFANYKNVKQGKLLKEAVLYLMKSKKLVYELFLNALKYCPSGIYNELPDIFSSSLSMISALSKVREKDLTRQFIWLLESSRGHRFLVEKKLAQSVEVKNKFLPDRMSNNLTDLLSSSIENKIDDFGSLFLDIQKYVPKKWIIISIDICQFSGDLLLLKITSCDDSEPLIIRLPLNRHASRDADERVFSFEDAKRELENIIESSNLTTKVEVTSSIKNREDKKSWWKTRYFLEKQLKELLENVDYCWLGGFRGIFDVGEINRELFGKFKIQFNRILQTYLPSRRQWLRNKNIKSGKVNSEVKETIDSKVDIDDNVLELFIKLGHPSKLGNTEYLEDLIYFAIDILIYHGEEDGYDEIDMDRIYVEVEDALRKYHDENEKLKREKLERREREREAATHIVLVIGKSCQNFPWESLPNLKGKSVSRMPSLTILLEALKKYDKDNLSIECKEKGKAGFFVLNPSGDLKNTQTTFEQKFKSHLKNWGSIIDRKPTEEEFVQALSDSSLFIYIGHGGGEQYIRSSTIRKLQRCSPSLLMGCSSGSLKENGELEPHGTAYSYLVGGCAMLVVNLWDVTDKDIDKFSMSVFQKWGLFREDYTAMFGALDELWVGSRALSICEAVAASRETCHLHHLNGSAPVVYGLPLTLS
ncbi:separase ASCRUDRAFT_81427 [Ascoidea rubescens DSM 1968]|uniref:separase n=1 Tax=Ascoidea rubescens DSM 1968 TaxID=1344418 RepID=A0A1D2VFX7_9ASCO|nr:hypothetical protein ASCRUDRAFT_81427 [Ascoidea rubescens DSM 1968]ODV60482.1 hypothetical protein ASCRUDRAFT_81427 [Ascoidea rubescens DSM 1968]